MSEQPAGPHPRRASLLQRALAVFILIALSLGAFLWAGRSLIQRPVESVYLDSQRLKALRTFELAIVPLQSVSGFEPPSAEAVRSQFAFCTDSLEDKKKKAVTRRTNNPCAGAGPHEELACSLRTINTRLDEMAADRKKNREGVLNEKYVVDLGRWTEGIRNQSVPCRDALGAARQVAARDGRLLGLFAWRELTSKKVAAASFAPEQSIRIPSRVLEQRNPWGGVPGCIYYGGAGTSPLLYVTDKRQSNRQACLAMRPREVTEKNTAGVFMAAFDPGATTTLRRAEPAHAPPESLDVILADLDNIRLPWKDLFRAYTEPPVDMGEKTAAEKTAGEKTMGKPIAASHGPNQLDRMKHKVDAGFNVHLTIDPEIQRVVQDTSSCYSGDAERCRKIGLVNDKTFDDLTKLMYEKAAVRMAAVAVIDLRSGRIDALGSAHSGCFRQEYDGPGRNTRDCPNLPTAPHYEPDRLLNHALYTDALPGSIIKPIMATGFLRDPKYRAKVLAERIAPQFVRLQDELKSSDSIAFLNRMFCSDKGWTNCERPAEIQKAAMQFGWDQGCEEGSFRCGRLNVLFGHADNDRVRKDSMRRPLGASVLYGRLLVEPASDKRVSDMQVMRDFRFDPAVAAACARGDFYKGTAEKKGWRKCHNRKIVYIESEGWGQGNARTTPVGAAGMLARLGAAANGQESLRLPYLVERITDAQSKPFELAAHQFHLADPVKIDIPQEDAALIVRGMLSHKGYGAPAGSRPGTAHSACLRVFDAATCNRIDWIAGKTGTPPYGNDDLTLKEIREKCASMQEGKMRGATRSEKADAVASCNHEQPYKWYIALFQTDDAQPGFNKAIAVLTERNWYRTGPKAGKVQSPGDKEANLSAELAFRIMARLRPAPPPEKKPGKT